MSSPQMYDVLTKLRELDAKNPNVVTDAIDNTEKMNPPVEEAKKAKPDYLDFDKDGDKKEPMKKALKDKKKKVDEAITITADSPEEAGMISRLMQLAGLQQVTPDMMPGADNVPVMKATPSVGGCGGGEYDNTPHEDVKGVESVTSQAGLDGVNGRKAPQDLRVKDPSDYADYTPRLKDLAGITSEEEVEEEWDNEPDEHYKGYDPDEYADKSDHATKNTRLVPARSGDNPLTAMEELEQQLMDAYDEFMSERELTDPEERERERLVKGMKRSRSDFERRYGDRGEEVMYATATKMAKDRK